MISVRFRSGKLSITAEQTGHLLAELASFGATAVRWQFIRTGAGRAVNRDMDPVDCSRTGAGGKGEVRGDRTGDKRETNYPAVPRALSPAAASILPATAPREPRRRRRRCRRRRSYGPEMCRGPGARRGAAPGWCLKSLAPTTRGWRVITERLGGIAVLVIVFVSLCEAHNSCETVIRSLWCLWYDFRSIWLLMTLEKVTAME